MSATGGAAQAELRREHAATRPGVRQCPAPRPLREGSGERSRGRCAPLERGTPRVSGRGLGGGGSVEEYQGV